MSPLGHCWTSIDSSALDTQSGNQAASNVLVAGSTDLDQILQRTAETAQPPHRQGGALSGVVERFPEARTISPCSAFAIFEHTIAPRLSEGILLEVNIERE